MAAEDSSPPPGAPSLPALDHWRRIADELNLTHNALQRAREEMQLLLLALLPDEKKGGAA